MCFSKSDLECGYVVNSIWEVQFVLGDSVMLFDGKIICMLILKVEQVQQYIDFVYVIIVYGVQGVSELYVIVLEGVVGGWEQMVSFEFVYVVLFCMKQYVQVYIDNCEGWIKVIKNLFEKVMVYDIFEFCNDWVVKIVDLLFGWVRLLDEIVVGWVVLQQFGLVQGSLSGKFIFLGKKYFQLYVVLLVFDKNGKVVGIWFSLLIDWDGWLEVIGGEG